MRVLALAFLLNGLAAAPLAVISRELAFRAKATVAIAAALTEGTFGIVLALRGAGYWSLVGAQLAGAAMTGVAAWWLAPWKPLGRFVWAPPRDGALRPAQVAGTCSVCWVRTSTTSSSAAGSAPRRSVSGTAFRWGRLSPQALGTIANQVAFPSYVAVRGRARARAPISAYCAPCALALPASLGLVVVAPVLVATLYPPRWAGMVTPPRSSRSSAS
jgi:PST family polysaccharide transporter